MKDKKAFLEQTAKDYALSFEVVEKAYHMYPDLESFYEELESILTEN